jgi:hypothetical protein
VPDTEKPFQELDGTIFGFADIPAGGYRSYPGSGKVSGSRVQSSIPQEIRTDHYMVKFSDGGLIEQITTKQGAQLLKTDEYLGGEVRALISDKWVDNRLGNTICYDGEVASIIDRSSFLDSIPVKERYFFFKNEPFIKVQVEFDFDDNEVGYFWLDETKINIYYPTAGSEIYHDIPFGYIQGREGRPLFATNWIYCGGLAYINRGNVKHWVRDGVVANMIAWGGRSFSNRMHVHWAKENQYDIRLYGKQKIGYYLIPYDKFDGNKIVRDVNAMTFPVFISKGGGEKSLYEVKDENLIVTSLYSNNEEVYARGYKLPSENQSIYRDWEIFNKPLGELE